MQANKSKKLSAICASFIGELGLSADDIEKTPLDTCNESTDDVVLLRKRIVKAVTSKVRLEMFALAAHKSIITQGQPLPQVGYWSSQSKFIKLGPTGMFNYQNKDGKTAHTDPLSNPEFIEMLFAA